MTVFHVLSIENKEAFAQIRKFFKVCSEQSTLQSIVRHSEPFSAILDQSLARETHEFCEANYPDPLGPDCHEHDSGHNHLFNWSI